MLTVDRRRNPDGIARRSQRDGVSNGLAGGCK